VLLYFTVVHAQPFSLDWLIVPGERVGPITATTSAEMLQTIFGPGDVESVDVYVGEGVTEPGAAVFPGDPTRRLEVLWTDAARTAVKEVRLRGNSTKWRTQEGISLGSTLKDIERLNGWPFRLVGFAWDYGGTITGCGRGHLRMLGCLDGKGTSQGARAVLRLAPSADARALPEHAAVIGDREFSSGHPAMQKLNPSVSQVIVRLSQ
jgi:hypothetical protein